MSFVLMVSNGCLRFLNNAGHFVLIFYEGVRSIFRRPFRTQMLLKQIEFIGVNSSFIIVLTGFFTGAVLALQSGKTLRLLNGEGATGSLVALSLLRELGPVMTGLMVAARCGSAMAAEIGTMKVTQQIDALKVMSVDPVSYLIAPRLLATTLIMPFLNLIFCMMGLFGSYLVAIGVLNINEAIYFDKIQQYVGTDDLWNGMVKSVFFGMIVSTVGCRMGYVTSGGAEGVGRSTTQAVVIASVSILVADYFLTAVMF